MKPNAVDATTPAPTQRPEAVDAIGTTMPPDVLDWVRQFPNQTIHIHIHITCDGFVSLWNRDPNKEATHLGGSLPKFSNRV